jgi:8-oxo-dGTP pyrophosphatase MutT (NUDIX family)
MKRYGNFYKKTPTVIKKSYGVACCRYNTKEKHLEILMVKKRYTFYYIEFIRGHYSPGDNEKLIYLFNRISNEEKVEIESMNFDQMWYRVWRYIPSPDSNEYIWFVKCKRKFDMNFSSPRDQLRLRNLLSQSTSSDCMWEIPKGRRDAEETELLCALRELQEESGYNPGSCMILPETMELRTSNNKAIYINKYFIALDKQSSLDSRYKLRSYKPKLSFNDARQISEIIDVRWMSLVEIKFLDQTNNFTRIVGNIFKILRARYKIPKLTEIGLL